eukprot:8674-Heterococcus_DN1.PRE.4
MPRIASRLSGHRLLEAAAHTLLGEIWVSKHSSERKAVPCDGRSHSLWHVHTQLKVRRIVYTHCRRTGSYTGAKGTLQVCDPGVKVPGATCTATQFTNVITLK